MSAKHLYGLGVGDGYRHFLLFLGRRVIPMHHFHWASFRRKLTRPYPIGAQHAKRCEVATSRAARPSAVV